MSYNLENKSANEIELFLSTDLEKGLDKKAVQARLKHRREGKLPTKDISFFGVVSSAVFRPSFAVLSIGLIMAYYMCDALEAVFCPNLFPNP